MSSRIGGQIDGEVYGVFSDLADPRAGNAVHDLTELLFIGLAALLCGAQSCTDMADFGRAKEGYLRDILRLDHGIPSHDTFSRVFRMLDPTAFEAAFRTFMAAFGRAATVEGVVAIDGKAVRGAFQRGRKSTPLHLVNVWAADARLALAQRTAPGRNEVAAALEVVQLLSLENCVVTADALHCHGTMARRSSTVAAPMCWPSRRTSRPFMRRCCAVSTPPGTPTRRWPSSRSAHGRYEHRHVAVVSDATLADRHGFPGIRAVARLTSHRRAQGQQTEVVVRYFLLSQAFPAARVLQIVRAHWTIENQLHWVLDVVFNEDGARNRKDHGPENIAILRKLALNILRAHPEKASIRRKIKRAGWDNAFLNSIIAHMR